MMNWNMRLFMFSAVLVVFATSCAVSEPVFTGEAAPPEETLCVWYRQPAGDWLEALPIGNGRLGGMVYGGVEQEQIQFNECTLWSGGPKEWNNPGALEVLPEIRRLTTEGKFYKAHHLGKKMMGPYTQSYMPMGQLCLTWPERKQIKNYRRCLNLDTGIVEVKYEADGTIYTEEVFISYPDQVFVIRLTSSKPGGLSFSASLNSRLQYATTSDGPVFLLNGRAPAHVDPNYLERPNPVIYDETGEGEGMRFQCRLMAVTDGGEVLASERDLRVEGATRVTLLLSAATSFNGFDHSPGREGRDQCADAAACLSQAASRTFESLREDHIHDHQRLFRRVQVNLGPAPDQSENLPSDQLVKAYGATNPALVALYFQYGRYLLISSSRPGGQTPNLQGIWNDELRAPWSSNYTLNINTEMNLWPAEVCNLSECHEPLFEMIRELSVSGARTAQINYGCKGWVTHHNTDIWRLSSPVGDWGRGSASSTWALWPMSGAWLCQHLWQHYEFVGDKAWLRDYAYPLMKGSAEFFLDFLVEDGNGYLVTNPSTSPENAFMVPEGRASVSIASTMDMALIWDLFSNCIDSAKDLDIDAEFASKLETARARLRPPQIGNDGRLMEWFQEFSEMDVKHPHTSHLWGVFPGRQISLEGTPDLAAAVKRTLERKTDECGGWASVWRTCMWARLRDGNHAYALVQRSLPEGGGSVSPNLFGSHPIAQLDCNYGFSASVAEMLLQSHSGKLRLLPALPDAWPNGSVKGLCARGGYEVDMTWSQAKLTEAVIHSHKGGKCVVVYGDQKTEVMTEPGSEFTLDGGLAKVPTDSGK